MSPLRSKTLARRGVVPLAVAAGMVALIMPSVAHAHPVDPNAYRTGLYYNGVYAPGHDQPRFYFESNFPGANNQASSYKNAVLRAANNWPTNWSSVGLRFQFRTGGYAELPSPAGPYGAVRNPESPARTQFCSAIHDNPDTAEYDPEPLSLVYWDLLPRNPQTGRRPNGEATTCAGPNSPSGYPAPDSFFMALNRNQDWHRRATTEVPNGRTDLQGTATHELGHALGQFFHFDDNATVNDAPIIPPNDARCGQVPERATMCRIDTKPGKSWSRDLDEHDVHTFQNAYP